MAKDAGYWQAVENYAYEIDNLSNVVLAINDGPLNKVIGIMSGSGSPEYEQIKAQSRRLDLIFKVIEQTYEVTEREFERDVDIALSKRIQHFINQVGENDDEDQTGN